MRRHRIVRFFAVALFFLIFAAAFGQVVLHLWNWVVPATFGLHTITYWQALGLLCLSWILFGGPRGWFGHHSHWRHRMRERWEAMTPEERERFREGMAHRCGHGHAKSPTAETKA